MRDVAKAGVGVGGGVYTHAWGKLAHALTVINEPPTRFPKDPGNPSVQPHFRSNYLYEVLL